MSQERNLSALEIAVANLVDNLEACPDVIKPAMKKLADLRPVAEQIEKSIQQNQQSLAKLGEQQAKIAGSFDALMSLIEETIPAETLEQHGKVLVKSQKVGA
jgi:hypothetical protein